ncbi:hypothetical protein [Verrucomicrobium sp. BvORR106]|uniref:hypothetical protein n=1 Tax=Verrucomicrobium sp. BvORR106 TaxID=1403819 RepID=UPI000AD1C0F6|nr:hypothetical protein [Verrucomicrobium sp. BvORR106]
MIVSTATSRPAFAMRLPALFSVLTLSTLAQAGTPVEAPAHSHPAKPEVNWLTGEGANIGGFLFPHVHFQSVYGGTTADEVEHLGAGHHDPQRDGWTIQGFEFGTSLRAGEYVEGFGTYHLYYDRATDDWDGEFEEWFGKIKNLPGGLELRGGRYLSRFGLQNPIHMHGWDFVDSSLVNGRFLGDDGLYTIGGEVSWTLPVSWTSVLSVSVGVAPEHEHEHEGHEHSEEALFEAEGSLFSDTFVTANWTNQWNYNDFHQFRYGASGAWGDNEFGRTSQVYGVHLEYLWRQNGLEAGGRYFRWRTEAMYRRFGAVGEAHEHEHDHDHEHEEAGHHAEEDHDHDHDHEAPARRTLDEFGMYTALAYGFDSGIEFGLRGDYVQGIAAAGLDERFRLSPSVTWYLNKNRTLYFRTQYNYDHSNDFGDEHSLWGQVGFNWGGSEVR